MNIKPLGKRVLIQETKVEEITKSGIVLPDTISKDKSNIGEILSVGSEVKEIKAGDKVVYEKYAGTEVKDNDVTYLIVEEKNVLGIVE